MKHTEPKVKLSKADNRPVSIDGWDLAALDEIRGCILSVAAEAIEGAFKDDAYAYLPIEFISTGEDGIGGPPVSDPLSVYIRVGFTPSFADIEYPTWKFSVYDLVIELLDEEREVDVKAIRRVRDALLELVGKCDAVLSNQERNGPDD